MRSGTAHGYLFSCGGSRQDWARASAPGSVNASAAVGAESAYLDAFFESHLDGAPSSLLPGRSRTHPVVTVIARRG